MKKFFGLTPFLLLLIGCATTPAAPKVELSLEEYNQYAFKYSRLDGCLRDGYMDNVTHAKGRSIYNRSLAGTGKIVNYVRLDRAVSDIDNYVVGLQQKMDREMKAEDLEKDRKLVKFTCQKLSGELQVGYSEIQDLDRQIQRQKEINQQRQNQIYTPTYNKSSTTSCHQFGSQVICNSY